MNDVVHYGLIASRLMIICMLTCFAVTQESDLGTRGNSASLSIQAFRAHAVPLIGRLDKQSQKHVDEALVNLGQLIASATVGWTTKHAQQVQAIRPLFRTNELVSVFEKRGLIIPAKALVDAVISESSYDLYRVYLWRTPGNDIVGKYLDTVQTFEASVGAFVASRKIPALVNEYQTDAAIASAVRDFLARFGSSRLTNSSGMEFDHNLSQTVMLQVISHPERLAASGLDMSKVTSVREVVNALFEPEPGGSVQPALQIYSFETSIFYEPAHGKLVQLAYVAQRQARQQLMNILKKNGK